MKSIFVIFFSLCFLIIVNSSNAANSVLSLANKANSDELKVMVNNGEMLSHINKEILNQITMHGNEELLFDITKKELYRSNFGFSWHILCFASGYDLELFHH